jgi:hypothetical protein
MIGVICERVRSNRLCTHRRYVLRGAGVRAAAAQAGVNGRHGRRVLVVGGSDGDQQRRVGQLLHARPVLDGAAPFVFGNAAGRDDSGDADPPRPGPSAALRACEHVGGGPDRRVWHRGSARPGHAPHRGVRASGHPVDMDRVPSRAPHRHLRRHLAAHARGANVLADLRPARVRPASDRPGGQRSRRQRTHAGQTRATAAEQLR